MKNALFTAIAALLITLGTSNNTKAQAQDTSTFNYEHLYKMWVVDTIIVSGPNAVDIETVKHEYQFTKEGTNCHQGTRTTIMPQASVEVAYSIKDDSIHFDPAATFPNMRFDEQGSPVFIDMNASLPPYKIIALTLNSLILKNEDVLMKLSAKE